MTKIVQITSTEWAEIQAARALAGTPVEGEPDLVEIEIESLPHVRFTYPDTGATTTLSTSNNGITRIDFKEGNIENPDGDYGRLPRYLSNSPGSHANMHFLYIYSNQQCKIRTISDDNIVTNWIPVKTDGELTIRSETYRFVEIYASVSGTAVMVIAGTDRNMDISQSVGISGITEKHSTIDTDSTTQFTTAIAAGSSDTEEISGLSTNTATITRMSVNSAQNLHYRVEFHRSSDFDGDSYLSHIDVDLPGDGIDIGTERCCGYDVEIDVYDILSAGKLYLRLVNLSGTAKNAGATGKIAMRFGYIPRT